MCEPFKGAKVEGSAMLLEVIVQSNHIVCDELNLCQSVAVVLGGIPYDSCAGYVCHGRLFGSHGHGGECHERIIIGNLAGGVRTEESMVQFNPMKFGDGIGGIIYQSEGGTDQHLVQDKSKGL